MNLSPIFFGECTYTNLFWKDFLIFVHAFSSQSLFLLYKDVLFGCHNFTKEDNDTFSDKLIHFSCKILFAQM